MEKDTLKTKLSHKLFGKAPALVTESHKELRFTRSRQASFFFVLFCFFTMLSIATLSAMLTCWGATDSHFFQWSWLSIIPLAPAFIALRIALHCIRHAYLILTPMGVEIFPFFKPEKNLQVLFWHEIDHCTFTKRHFTIHFNAQQTAGVVLSLSPLSSQQIFLLNKAITARTSSD